MSAMPRRCYRSPCSPSSCSPCSLLPLLPLLLILAPIVFPLLKLALTLIFYFAVANAIATLASVVASSCCVDSADPRACFKAVARSEPATEQADKGTSTVREQLKKEAARDMSSMHVEANDASELRIDIAIPGVRQEDLVIRTQDRVLHVSGESTKGSQVFKVERRVALPSIVEVDSAAATCENGILTIIFARKASKTIPVVQVVATTAAATSSHVEATAAESVEPPMQRKSKATLAEEAEAKASDSDEWEPLLKEVAASSES